MILPASALLNSNILSRGHLVIGRLTNFIVSPDNLKVIGLEVEAPDYKHALAIRIDDVIEVNNLGVVVNDSSSLIKPSMDTKILNVYKLHFSLTKYQVRDKKKHLLGRLINFTIDTDTNEVYQLIIKRPFIKSFSDPELTIPTEKIIEITDKEIIIDNEKEQKADVIKEKIKDLIPKDTETAFENASDI